MLELLETNMYLMISIKLHTTIIDAKNIMIEMEHRLMNDKHFNIDGLSEPVQDSFNYYLTTQKYLRK